MDICSAEVNYRPCAARGSAGFECECECWVPTRTVTSCGWTIRRLISELCTDSDVNGAHTVLQGADLTADHRIILMISACGFVRINYTPSSFVVSDSVKPCFAPTFVQ